MTGARADSADIPLESYDDALAYLYALRTFGTRLGLERIRALLDKLGEPDRQCRFLHIAGTNGKGSTAAFLEGILRAHGLTTGLYTSPHLVRFSERIRVNGCEVSEQEVLGLIRRVGEAAAGLEGEPPTFFEIVTAMAACYFADRKVDAVVWETGMGGRLDATNAVQSCASIITPIGMDHTRWLGDTLEEIAAEKAGIVKEGAPVFTNETKRESLRVIASRAQRAHSAFCQVVGNAQGGETGIDSASTFVYESHSHGHGRYAVSMPQVGIAESPIGLRGMRQCANAALALAAAHWYCEKHAYEFDAHAASQALTSVRWPARCEVVSCDPLIVLDCAHNAESAVSLANVLDEFEASEWVLVFGALADKHVADILGPLLRHAREIWYLKPVSPRGLAPGAFQALVNERGAGVHVTRILSDAEELWRVIDADEQRGRPTVIAGSCYLAGDVLAARRGGTRDIRVDDPHSDARGKD